MKVSLVAAVMTLGLCAPAAAFDFDYGALRRLFAEKAEFIGLEMRLHVVGCAGRANIAHCQYEDGKGVVARTDSYDGGMTTRKIEFLIHTHDEAYEAWAPIIPILSEIASPSVSADERAKQILAIMPGRKDSRYPYQTSTLIGRIVYKFDVGLHDVLSFSAEDLDAH